VNYDTAITYLDSLQPKNMRMELGPINEACNFMDCPQQGWPSVHVSGTNGKGSTAAFLSSIFQHSGYKVGLFTSPHLVDVRERIQVDRHMISQEDLAALITKIRDALPDDRMRSRSTSPSSRRGWVGGSTPRTS
jgi:dihydrofolate synthase/folylpolyglutamate synthase